jgi:hypothetical protein
MLDRGYRKILEPKECEQQKKKETQHYSFIVGRSSDELCVFGSHSWKRCGLSCEYYVTLAHNPKYFY